MPRRGASIALLLLLLVGTAGARLMHVCGAHGSDAGTHAGCASFHECRDPTPSTLPAPADSDQPSHRPAHECQTCDLLATAIGAAPGLALWSLVVDLAPGQAPAVASPGAPARAVLASIRARPPPGR